MGCLVEFIFGGLIAFIAWLAFKGKNGKHEEEVTFAEERDDTVWLEEEHTDSGRCNGDCAHCPPHYGYRYGRWYYGHGHQHGCQRGGNGGASGRTYRD